MKLCHDNKLTAPVASSTGPINTTTQPRLKIASEPNHGAQPLSSEELALPFVLDSPAANEDVAALPESQTRLQDLKRQLSEQEARAADLDRQYAKAGAELIARQHRTAILEGLARLKLGPVVSALGFLKSALKDLLTRRAFRWQALGLRKAREDELRNAQEAVSDIEAVLHNLEDEQAGQFSRIEGLTRLIAEQEAIVVRDQVFEDQ